MKARFWNHPDAPLVDLVWYFTDLPFLPYESVINSRDWTTEDLREDILGEKLFAPRPYNGRLVTPGLRPGHICGKQSDFEQGPVWPPEGEPLVYDDDGIPSCCHRLPVFRVTSGSRPAAIVSTSPPPPPPYTGRVTSGTRPAADFTVYPPPPPPPFTGSVTSGSLLDADVTVSPPPPPPPFTGSVTSGSLLDADVTVSPPPPPPPPPETCPMPALALADAVPGWWDTCCGLDAEFEVDKWQVWPTQPGVTYTWLSDERPGAYNTYTLWRGNDSGSATAWVGGLQGSDPWQITFVAEYDYLWMRYDGLEFPLYPGSACILTNEGINCPAAWVASVDETLIYTYGPLVPRAWFRYDGLSGGTTYQINYGLEGGAATDVRVWVGADCDSQTEVTYIYHTLGYIRFHLDTTGPVWVSIDAPSGHWISYTLTLSVFS